MSARSGTSRQAAKAAWQITVVYLIVALSWILLSDHALQLLVESPARRDRLQTFKGLGFIMTTAASLFALIYWYVKAIVTVERRATEREEQFAEAFDQGVAGMALLDPSGRIHRINDLFCHLLGYPREELVGQLAIAFVHPEDQASAGSVTEQLLQGASARLPMEARFVRKDGSIVWVILQSRLHRSDAGDPAYFITQVVDTTERRRAEEELNEHRIALEHASRLITLGELASGLTHELTQPLTAIGQYSDAATRRIEAGKESISETLYEAVFGVRDEVARARQIVERWRAFSRRQSPKTVPTDLNALIRESVEMLAYAARREDVQVRTELAPHLPVVQADPIQIQQVLVNLVSNGIDATADLEPDRPRWVVIRTWDAGGVLAVSVCDSGPPIDDAIRARLFEPFFTTKPGGVGLGLPISRSIVQSHGGQLTVGRGHECTEFSFTLPVHHAKETSEVKHVFS